MYDKKQQTPKKLYPKILFTFTISTTITIILLSTILYLNFENITLQTTNSFVRDNLTQVSYSATVMNNTAHTLLMEMTWDYDIRRLMFDYKPDAGVLSSVQNRLTSYVSANKYINSIYIYNEITNTFYDSGMYAWTREDIYDKEILYILDNFNKYQKLTPIPRVIKNSSLNPNASIQSKVYTYVLYDNDLIRNTDKLDKAIIVNINEGYIKEMMNTMSSIKENEIYIIDGNGLLLQSNTSTKTLSKITDQPFIQKVIRDSKSQGSFIETVDNKKSLVTFVSSNVLDWKFICVTPYSIVLEKVNYMKNKTILICSILLTIGILASYLLSKRLYTPISFLQDNLQTLKLEQRSNLILQKQVLLKSIVQSGISSNTENIMKTFDLYKIKIDPLDKYLVMVLKIDNYFNFCNENSLTDRRLFKFAIMNVSSELCEPHFKNETVDLDDNHIVLILNYCESIENQQLIRDISSQIIETVQTCLNISISISISSLGQNLCTLNTKYDEALETSQYRVFSGFHSVLLYQDIHEKHSKVFSYSIQKENKLIDSLMLGNIEEVQTIFEEILNSAQHYSYRSFILTLTRMSTAIYIAIDILEKNSNYHINYDFSKFIMELNMLECLEDIKTHFSSLFDCIFEKLLERKDAKYDELIAKVTEIVTTNYHDKNLSLDSIADTIGISASYLGKLFKKYTSNTISDYLTQTRLEASKRLLSSTDYSIYKITDKIGLTYSNYFYKIFKKTYGITPSEYKKNLSLQKSAPSTDS